MVFGWCGGRRCAGADVSLAMLLTSSEQVRNGGVSKAHQMSAPAETMNFLDNGREISSPRL